MRDSVTVFNFAKFRRNLPPPQTKYTEGATEGALAQRSCISRSRGRIAGVFACYGSFPIRTAQDQAHIAEAAPRSHRDTRGAAAAAADSPADGAPSALAANAVTTTPSPPPPCHRRRPVCLGGVLEQRFWTVLRQVARRPCCRASGGSPLYSAGPLLWVKPRRFRPNLGCQRG